MPSKSPEQARLMAAIAHGWHPSHMKNPPPLSVAKDFNEADTGRKKFAFGGLAQTAMMDPRMMAMMTPTPAMTASMVPTPSQVGYMGPAKSLAKPAPLPGMMFPRPTPSFAPGNAPGALSAYTGAPTNALGAFSNARPIGTPGTAPNALLSTAGDVNAMAGNRLNRLNQGMLDMRTNHANPRSGGRMLAKGGQITHNIESLMEKIRPYYDRQVKPMTQADVDLLNNHIDDYVGQSGKPHPQVLDEIQKIIQQESPYFDREEGRPNYAKGGRLRRPPIPPREPPPPRIAAHANDLEGFGRQAVGNTREEAEAALRKQLIDEGHFDDDDHITNWSKINNYPIQFYNHVDTNDSNIHDLMAWIRPFYDKEKGPMGRKMNQDDLDHIDRQVQNYAKDSGRSYEDVTEEIQRMIQGERPDYNQARGGRI